MESHQEHKQPIRDDTTTTTNTVDENINKSKQDKRKAMAKRGLKSLAVMVAVPTFLTLASTCLSSGSRHGGYGKSAGPSSSSWLLPPPWALHLASLAASFLMGLSAWLVWADGGFHRRPRAFQVYAAWLLLNLAWNPIVLGCGATRVGLVVGLGMVGALVGCCRFFKEVNQIAGDLVKPCLALSGLLVLVNLKLVFT